MNDGAVLPIPHLNGYKIANPAVLARLPGYELDDFIRGLGHDPTGTPCSPTLSSPGHRWTG